MGENLAAIDIGTNSIHLVVARFDDAGHFEVIGRREGDACASARAAAT